LALKLSLFGLVLSLQFLIAPVAHADQPVYLGLMGHVSGISQDVLLAEISQTFGNPLLKMKPHVNVYYNGMVDHAGSFSLGLIAEPTDLEGSRELTTFIGAREKQGFHGLAIAFQPVNAIEENVKLMAGTRGATDQDINVDSVIDKTFTLKTVTEWENFSNRIGFSIDSKTTADFQAYLAWFFGSEASFQDYASRILTHANVVMADLNPVLVLENGSKIDSESMMTPFFNMPFIRPCWSADYEHGMCYQASLP
jgi:hypothetical protein